MSEPQRPPQRTPTPTPEQTPEQTPEHSPQPSRTPGPSGRDPDLDAIEAFRTGDPGAFDRLVVRHERRIYRLACRIVGDRDAALDAAQEAFVRAWRALPRFEGASLFSTWLTRIAINQCRNELRRRRTVKHTRPLSLDARIPGSESEETHRETLVAAGPDGYEATRGNEVQRAFETALAEVDAEDREVLVLRDVEDLSYESIAEVLDVAIGTVRSRLHRARTALRRRMAPVLDR